MLYPVKETDVVVIDRQRLDGEAPIYSVDT